MKKFKYKHIIWDWNGTLCNDLTPTCKAFNFCRKQVNIPLISEEEFQEIYSHPIIDMYRKCKLLSDSYTYKQIGEDFFKEYNKYSLTLHKDAIKVLDCLKGTGVSMSLASANYQEFLLRDVKNFNLEKYFDFVVGTSLDNIGGRKDVQVKKIIDNIDVPLSEIVAVGDTLNDLHMAQSAGIDCILLASGMVSYKRLSQNHDVVYHDLSEFLNVFNL